MALRIPQPTYTVAFRFSSAKVDLASNCSETSSESSTVSLSVRTETALTYRNKLSLRPKSQRIVVIEGGNRYFNFYPIAFDGDCGFQAIAKAFNLNKEAGKSSVWTQIKVVKDVQKKRLVLHRAQANKSEYDCDQKLTQKQVRRILATELEQNKETYFLIAKEFGMTNSGVSLAKLKSSIKRSGVYGHWLGALWGPVEILALANAMNLNIELYTYDPVKQVVRNYDSIGNPATALHTIGLFYSGASDGGHFDLLLPTDM